MVQLKNYQKQSLERLRDYLETARLHGDNGNVFAYKKVQTERYGGPHFPPFQPLDGLPQVPYACLRLPTGGGKTLLCAHSICLARNTLYDHGIFPLTLWMVPSITVKKQTLETLKNPAHANFKALQAAFGSQFRVFDIEDFATLRPQDIENSACIVVSTFASLRVEDTTGRRVYDHHEELEGHFARMKGKNNIQFSFVNLLHWHRPLVLVDEAHNAKSALSMQAWRRVNPRAVVEYTATPSNNSNVIESITAAQLKAEQMIKLPIVFSQHLDWQQAVAHSIQTRAMLEKAAYQDADYIRPLVLFQAENVKGAVTVQVLRDFLVQHEGIAEAEIAIATGEQRELDDIHLLDANCPIRYVITVQALKEGWDCSFAYVLCSLMQKHSTAAAEQLLGRVLRMPYAKARSQPVLNQAYAYVAGKGWAHAATRLKDLLLDMGFERQEAQTSVHIQPPLPLADAAEHNAPLSPVRVFLTQQPDLSALDLTEQARVTLETVEPQQEQGTVTGAGCWVNVADADENLLAKISAGIRSPKDKTEWQLHSEGALRQQPQRRTPAENGVAFVVPQLCLRLDDGVVDNGVVLLEKHALLGDAGFDPMQSYTPLTQADFCLSDNTTVFEADIQGEKIKISIADSERQLPIAGMESTVTAVEFAAQLMRNLYDVVFSHYMANGKFLEYIQKTVHDLLARSDISLAQLQRGSVLLEKVIRERLQDAQKAVHHAAMQQVLLTPESRLMVDLRGHGFEFPRHYPVRKFYDGHLHFKKHYYPMLADMNKEEADCALELEKHAAVKFWVRNLEKQMKHAFSLPTSSDWFYPDFVAQLHDDRILVVEYKGGHLSTTDDSKEKETIGKAWAKISGNVFLMAVRKDDAGLDVAGQLRQLLG